MAALFSNSPSIPKPVPRPSQSEIPRCWVSAKAALNSTAAVPWTPCAADRAAIISARTVDACPFRGSSAPPDGLSTFISPSVRLTSPEAKASSFPKIPQTPSRSMFSSSRQTSRPCSWPSMPGSPVIPRCLRSGLLVTSSHTAPSRATKKCSQKQKLFARRNSRATHSFTSAPDSAPLDGTQRTVRFPGTSASSAIPNRLSTNSTRNIFAWSCTP